VSPDRSALAVRWLPERAPMAIVAAVVCLLALRTLWASLRALPAAG
jgi:hypothetical protein